MQEGFDGVKIIKLLGREDFFFNKFKYHNVNLNKITIKTQFFHGLPRLLFEFLGIVLITLSLFFLYYSEKNLSDIIQILTIFIAASFRILPSGTRIMNCLQYMKLGYPALKTLSDELKGFQKKFYLPHKKFNFKKNIVVDIKKFNFPNTTSNFEITNINFKILKGQKIGIIGATASGKSTIIDILSGVLKPDKGDILVDGISIFSNLDGWQSIIGMVPQKTLILDASLRENILFGLDKTQYKDKEINSLIKKINLDPLINRLNNGLDGKIGEKGINISGGEIQRIGICRALIYDPEILFLDEATSSLDTFTEAQILNEIKIFNEKTIISIAHRINTLKNCDIIYRFENGKLVDKGNYSKFKIN